MFPISVCKTQKCLLGENDNVIFLDQEFYYDLAWLRLFLSSFNGVVLCNKKPSKNHVEIDASLTGLGALGKHWVYTAYLSLASSKRLGSVHLEMINVSVATKLWARQWSGKNCG